MDREQIEYLPLDRIHSERQVREHFDDESIRALAESLKSVGQLQPIRVRLDAGRLVIVDGERRYRAAKALGWTTLAAIIEQKQLDEVAVVQRQYISNCHREDLTPLEKARAMATLVERTGWKVGELALRLGVSPAAVTRHLALLNLPPELQSKVATGKIAASAAYDLSRIEDPAEQQRCADDLEAGQLTRDGLSDRVKARAVAKGTGSTQANPRVKPAGRTTAELGGGRSVTITGPVNTFDDLIDILDALLAKCRKNRGTGMEIDTFLRMLKDQAKAPQAV
jgi:ParB family transcriptional regulator, chromosome partitioning protein